MTKYVNKSILGRLVRLGLMLPSYHFNVWKAQSTSSRSTKVSWTVGPSHKVLHRRFISTGSGILLLPEADKAKTFWVARNKGLMS